MKLKVTFREYTLPYTDPDTKEEERGEYIGSFTKEVEGESPADISATAVRMAEEFSKQNESDVRVWEIPISVTPRGIKSA